MKKYLNLILLVLLMLPFAGCHKSIENQLKDAVKEINKKCPQKLDDGLVMTLVYDDGTYVVAECEVDENLYDIAMMKPFASTMKEGIANYLSTNDDFMTVYSKANRGMIYKYIGNKSKDSIDIVFTPQEIKNLAK